MAPIPPLCWNCRYDLSGTYVEGVCPECGTPVWSSPPTDQIVPDTLRALYSAGLGLAAVFVWIGPSAPVAFFCAVYAIANANRAIHAARHGRVAHANLRPARVAFWVAVGTVVATVLISLGLLFDFFRDIL